MDGTAIKRVGILVFFVLLLARNLPAQANFLFPGQLFPVGSHPTAALAADLNGDGKMDLVVVNSGGNSVSVLLGNGDGSFLPQKTFATDFDPFAIVIADVNGDGIPDIITANGTAQSVSVLLGNGDGTFQPAKNIVLASAPADICVTDIDGDGKLDIAAAGNTSTGGGVISVLRGNGDGTFQAPITSTFAATTPLLTFTFADVNGDGKLDAVLTTYYSSGGVGAPPEGGVLVVYGDGTGHFANSHAYPIAGTVYSYANIDVNGDGIPDAILIDSNDSGASPYSTVIPTVILGTSKTSRAKVYSSNLAGFVPVDFNGDGKIDLWYRENQIGRDTIYFGDGKGGFEQSGTVENAVVASPVAFADFNGDGVADEIGFENSFVGTFSGNVLNYVGIFPGNGDGSFQALTELPAFDTSTTSIFGNAPIAMGDLTGNGRLDIVAAEYCSGCNSLSAYNGLLTYLQQADGSLQGGALFNTGVDPVAVVLADVNGDGKLDALTADNLSNTASVLLGNGDGTFMLRQSFAVGKSPSALQVADVNHDNKPDALVANSGDNTLSVLLGNGDGTLQTQATYPVGMQPAALAVADFNGDGNPDAAVANTGDGSVSILLGNAGGTFQPQTKVMVGSKPTAVVARDFNGDGKMDLVVANSGDNTVSVLLGNGDGTFQAPVTYTVGNEPSTVVVDDLNGDGKPDIAVADTGDANINVLLGNGDGTFQTAAVYYDPDSHPGMVAADINADGVPNLVNPNYILYGYAVLPRAYDGNFATPENQAVTGVLQGGAPAGRSPTFAIVGKPKSGTVQLTNATSGAFTYTPDPKYFGPDFFTYRVTDGVHYSRTASVGVYVSETASNGGSSGSGGGSGGKGGGGMDFFSLGSLFALAWLMRRGKSARN